MFDIIFTSLIALKTVSLCTFSFCAQSQRYFPISLAPWKLVRNSGLSFINCNACPTEYVFHESHYIVSRCIGIWLIFPPMFFYRCWETGLLTAWVIHSFIVRYWICRRARYFLNRALTDRDGTQRAAWKRHPWGAALSTKQIVNTEAMRHYLAQISAPHVKVSISYWFIN